MKPQPLFIGMNSYRAGKGAEEIKQIYGIKSVVKLNSNENPYGFSENVKKAIIHELSNLSLYPDSKANLLGKRIANHLDIQPDKIIFGNGTDELIRMICRVFLGPGTNTVMSGLSFPQYKRNAIMEGARVLEVPNDNGRHNIKGMTDSIDKNTSVIWICNPNNPTGEYVREPELIRLLDSVDPNVLVVCDEAYYEYVEAIDFPDSIALMKRYPNLMVLRTFSKAYGLAALRIGYGVGQSDLIRLLDKARETFNTSRLAQVAAMAAFEDQDFIKGCQVKNRRELENYYSFCWRYGLTYYPSQGNFIFIDLKRPTDKIAKQLLSKGFIIQSGNEMGFKNGARITLGTSKQNDELMVHLSQLLNTTEKTLAERK